MKKLLAAIALLAIVTSGYSQGRVNFSNGAATPITLSDTGAPISGAGTYTFGLYVGTAGTAENSLVLAITGANTALAGRMSGGNPAPLTAPWDTGTAPNTYPLTFQIRGWSTAAGSYNAALASGRTDWYTGKSALGTVTPTFSPTGAAALFGAGAGNVGGFALSPVPEPSSIALGLLGLGAVALFRRRK